MIREEANLKAYNTFGVNVRAKKLAIFENIEQLDQLIRENNTEEMLVIGGGSNVLFTDHFSGLVLLNRIKGIAAVDETEDFVYVRAGAGEIWHEFVLFCIEKGWGGVENLSLIPGSVGASPMQNIGAYGVEIKDVFDSLNAYEIGSGKVQRFTHSECEFGYRESVFKKKLKNKYIITEVTFKLTKKHQLNTSYGAIEEELSKQNITTPGIKDVSDAVIKIRRSKLPDPLKIGNAGSFFKNPVISRQQFEKIRNRYENIPHYTVSDSEVKLPAGWLIDQAGWKGKRFDKYGVHVHQALVLVNYGGATGKEIFDLSEKIIKDIEHKYGITLEREVNII
ncbi:MAG: UDP-N-acetylmuramate dehydrogenase [Brumimicrobium sp.]|nr:UDP-N-acetylmuramate dehydrogenase [Brumimicrobium sp.]